MGASQIITFCDLRGQSVKPLRRRLARVLWSRQLPCANRVPDLNPGDGTTRRPERFEAEHGMREAFDRSMVLFDSLNANDKTVSAPLAGG
jgi:hypothetical protein